MSYRPYFFSVKLWITMTYERGPDVKKEKSLALSAISQVMN